ncbi:endolysin [Arthrobacter phage Atuin]|nr:endolysin [Arthrobacter phage Atuin]
MELIIILFFLAVTGVGVGVSQSENHATVKRALKIGNSHKQAAIEAKKDPEVSQRELERYFKEALEAERAEQKLLSDNWEAEFLELLPDTDPQKNAHNMRKAGISVLEAKTEVEFIEPNIGYTGEQLTYCDRVVTKPTAYVREKPTDLSDFTATFQNGAVIRVYGWMRGRYVGKTDVWYQVKTKSFEGWVWSGSLNSQSTDGLARMEFPPAYRRETTPPALAQALHNIDKGVSKMPVRRKREF